MSSESDRLLIQQIRDNGPNAGTAWETLVHRYEGRLRAYVRRRLRDSAVADDVVQETFIGFLRGLANFDDRRELQTWLFTIASHKVTDQLRKLGRKPYQAGSDSDDELMREERDNKQRAASSIARNKERLELESAAVARGLRDILQVFLDKSDFKRVMVLELLFVKGWPNKQVASTLGITEQQVANYRFAAVKKLTEAMRESGLPADVFPELQGDGNEPSP